MNELIAINDQLMHLPAGVVVALFAIALGYVLKISVFLPNNRIPFVIVIFTAVLFPIVQYCADVMENTANAGLLIPINALIGFVIGFAAWIFHAQILKRFIDPKLFPGGNTAFFRNPNPPGTPPAQPPSPP